MRLPRTSLAQMYRTRISAQIGGVGKISNATVLTMSAIFDVHRDLTCSCREATSACDAPIIAENALVGESSGEAFTLLRR
jgi:hypothetical protein